MARRTRKFILDNATGTVYSNISDPALATSANVSAGVKPMILKVAFSAAGRPVAKANGRKSLFSKKVITISSVSLEVTASGGLPASTAAPVGGPIQVKLRKVTSGVSSFLGTFEIADGGTTSTTSVTYNILSTDVIFADVTDVGSIRTGLGLNMFITYYG